RSEEDQKELGQKILTLMRETGADVSVEDLGTVPDFVRESVTELGLPGYRVLRWEPGDPALYPPLSVAMTGTHDTEPLSVWWEALTEEERLKVAELPSVNIEPSPTFDATVRDALLRALYASGSNTVLIPLQDVFGWTDRINHPATIGNWNWTWTLPWPVDTIVAVPEAADTAARLRAWCAATGR